LFATGERTRQSQVELSAGTKVTADATISFVPNVAQATPQFQESLSQSLILMINIFTGIFAPPCQ
jgi:hypothetical protein